MWCILFIWLIQGGVINSRKKPYLKLDHIQYSTETNSHCYHYTLKRQFDYRIIYPCNNKDASIVYEYVQDNIVNTADVNVFIDKDDHVAIKVDGQNCHNNLAICASTAVPYLWRTTLC